MASKEEEERRILDEAIMWFVLRDSGASLDEVGFARWMQQSERHRQAYRKVEQTPALLRELLTRESRSLAHRRPSVLPALGWGVLAASLVAVTAMMWSPKFSGFPVSTGQDAHLVETYETVVGQQRSVKLRDGSILRLNTNTRVTFEFTDKKRWVTLSSGGEAMFWVQPDPSRPFEVVTARATALVVGTQFNVYAQPDRTTVSVVQGGVRVLPVATKGGRDESEGRQSLPVQVSSEGIVLHAEEQVSVESGGMLSAVAKVNEAELDLWQQGVLSFDGVTWGEAASAFNRYNSRQLVIIGEALRGRRLNKEFFRSDSMEGFVALLRSQDPKIVVEKTRDAIVIRSR